MMKKAFTMLELVMVIVILGIVASIGAEIIAKLYENYLKTRSINKLQVQTELVLDQIAKRLQFRIKDSVRAINTTTGNSRALPDANATHNVIEWIGISNESFIADGWSGFIDLDSPNTDGIAYTLDTKGSDLNTTNNIIRALSYNKVSLDAGTNNPAIIFKNMGRNNVNAFYTNLFFDHTIIVQRILGTTILNINGLDGIANNEIFEQYYLSQSAYAIVPVLNPPTNDFNLTLRYNYQPWHGDTYNGANDHNTSTLMEHVSTFRFTQIGETIRMKLCINDANQSGDYNFAFCKERVIF